MANSQSKGPPGPDVSSAPKLISVTGALYAVTLFFYVARMYTRLRPVPHLGWDDYTITAALVRPPRQLPSKCADANIP